MGDFLLASWPAQLKPRVLEKLKRSAVQAGWSQLVERLGLWVGGSGPRPPPVTWLDDAKTLVVGDLVVERCRALPPPSAARQRFQSLLAEAWGRYVAFSLSPSGQVEAVMRDPSGSRDCIVWRHEGIQFAASAATSWLVEDLKPRWAVDWDLVADMLVEPTLMSGPVALKGVASVAPGEMRTLTAPASSFSLWSPAEVARQPVEAVDQAASLLEDAVDRAVAAYATLNPSVLVEVSGGLDSSIVAASLRHHSPDREAIWTHVSGPFKESDERSYAACLAAHLGISLTSVERPKPIAGRAMDFVVRPAFRPSLNRIDLAYDRDQAALCQHLGVHSILTGKGGDVVFGQAASSLIVSDAMRAHVPAAAVKTTVTNTARRLRWSAWAVVREAVVANLRRMDEPKAQSAGLVRYAGRRATAESHAWLANLKELPVAKQMQISILTSQLSLHGPCQRTEVADLLHPLMSQPVIEACLAIPTHILSTQGRDRGLARDVFRSRLPERIVHRRSKAESTSYFGRCIDAELPAVRAHLLDGRLAAQGLLDVHTLERSLAPDRLIWENRYGDIMILAAVETWVRAWDRG